MEILKINSLDISHMVSNLKIEYNVLLSSSSGRNAKGDNVVDVVGKKDKVIVTFKALKRAEMESLLSAIEPYVLSLTFLNPKTNQLKTISAYVGTPAIKYFLKTTDETIFDSFELSFVQM